MKSSLLRLYAICCICLFETGLQAQSNLAIGQWQQFLPFQTSQYVTGGGGDVFFSTGTALAIVHDDMSIEYLSKIEGLSGVNIKAIHYNDMLDVLVIGYGDGNIDLVYDDGIINKNEILLNPNIQASRAIKSIYSDDQGIVYLTTDFGLVEMDIERNEFETIFTPSAANQVAEFEGYLYMALDNGIYRIERNGIVNFIDFNLWEFYGPSFGLPDSYFSKGIATFDGHLYSDIDGDLYRIDDIPEEIFNEVEGKNLNYLYAGNNNLYAGFQCLLLDGGECDGKTIGLDKNGMIKQATSKCSRRPRYVYEDVEGMIWFADNFDILGRTSDLDISCFPEMPNTPRTADVQDVKVVDEVLYVAAGGADANFSSSNNKTGTVVLKEGRWEEYGYFSDLTPTLRTDDSHDHYQIVAHPTNGKIFIATARSGVVEHDPADFSFLTYDESNSPLRRSLGDNGPRPRVFGIDFDSQSNLWATNYTATNPLQVLKADGGWQSFRPTNADGYTHIVVDQSDNKWIVAEDQGISFLIFNEGDLNDSSDDRVRQVSDNNSELESTTVRSLAVDRDGAVWVGTEQGAVVFNCGDPFDSNCTGSRPKVLKDDGFLAFLLENEIINTIAVDPANRKWFGTDNGIFVQSPSGDVEIFHFTEDNSPLLTDRVIELDIDPKTGIVYIGTERGLIAYKSDAIEGTENHSSTIRTYPNPVEPGYTGSIAIVGLANESSVKIANVNGQLVYETEALGGQAIWDGRDFSGRRVSSGVYYVFGASNSFFGDAKGAITKILFLH